MITYDTGPSVIQDIKINDYVVTWNEPVYQAKGTLMYDLIDISDMNRVLDVTSKTKLDIKAIYEENNLEINKNIKWCIKCKDINQNCSVSPAFSLGMMYDAMYVHNGYILL